jgi:hypothetical protein
MSQQQKSRGIVDIVFLIDATGSMTSCIDAVKENIHTFIQTLSTKDANNSSPVKHWRAKVVGYRDFDFNDYPPIEDNPFVESPEALRRQLSALVANGGHDEPESLLEAIYFVTNMDEMSKADQTLHPDKWRYRSSAARVVVIFSDASFKEPLRKPAGATLEALRRFVSDQDNFSETMRQLARTISVTAEVPLIE